MGAIGTLAGCHANDSTVSSGENAGRYFGSVKGRDPQATGEVRWNLADVFPTALSFQLPPNGEHSRIARAVFKLIKLWDPDGSRSGETPTKKDLSALMVDPFEIGDIRTSAPFNPQWPQIGAPSAAEERFDLLWTKLHEAATAWFTLAGTGSIGCMWMYVCTEASTQPGTQPPRLSTRSNASMSQTRPVGGQPGPETVRDGLTPTEVKEVQQAILELDD